MPDLDLARRIDHVAHLRGTFQLRSGQTSDTYFDKYRFESEPTILADIARAMKPMIPTGTELLAGLEMGGIPVVTMLSQLSGIPCLFVRKQEKAYGTAKFAEGPEFKGKRLLIVEDVVTSGGQIVLSTDMLKQAGAIVTDAICVIDRQSGGRENLQRAGIKLQSVFTRDDLESAGSSS